MKIHYQTSTPEVTISPAVTAIQGDIYQNIDFLQECGYSGVELMTRDATLIDRDKIIKYIKDKSMDISMICTGEVYGEDKLTLTDPSIDIRKKCYQRVKSLIDFAGDAGANFNVGRVRGFYNTQILQLETDKIAYDVFTELALYAHPKGVHLLIEPVTQLQTNFINSTQDGIEFCEKLNQPNINLMLDIYHMNIEDKNICDSIREAKPYIKHVHLAENNRRIAGTCGMDFKKVLQTLKEVGYQDVVSFEIFQVPDSRTCAKECINYILPILESL